MRAILDFVSLDEFLPCLLLIALLCFIGQQLAAPTAGMRQQARRAAAAAFLVYGVAGAIDDFPASLSELLLLTLRAFLAAGLVFGFALITLPSVHAVYGATLERWRESRRQGLERAREGAQRRSAEREAAERARREEVERKRLEPYLERQRQLAEQAQATMERERSEQIAVARAEVDAFYNEHAALLRDVLHPSLFKTQLRNRFAENLPAADAWRSVQEMIESILPQIAEGRERKRVADEEQRKKDEEAAEAERKRREPEERRNAIHRLTEWYQREKAAIEERLPDGPERDDILGELSDRYDTLMKETIREIKV